MIDIKTSGTQIIVTIDAGPEEIRKAKASTSGKSTIVASTSGFIGITIGAETLQLSLNLIRKG